MESLRRRIRLIGVAAGFSLLAIAPLSGVFAEHVDYDTSCSTPTPSVTSTTTTTSCPTHSHK